MLRICRISANFHSLFVKKSPKSFEKRAKTGVTRFSGKAIASCHPFGRLKTGVSRRRSIWVMNKKSVRGRKMLLGRRPDSSLSLRMTSERNCLLLRGLHRARNTGSTAKIRVVGLDLTHSPTADAEEFLRLPTVVEARLRETFS